ncbi:MAG: hypothetical protein AAGB05_02315 [Pseudomonadota bacterium]
MGALFDMIGYLAKPLFLAVVALVVLGLLNESQGPRLGGGAGFECQGVFNDPDWNRVLCQYHPGRWLDMPVSQLVPGLSGAAETDGNS